MLLIVCVHVCRCGLKTVINLQRPGEHASCGPNALESESGFSYQPEVFMENNSKSMTIPLQWEKLKEAKANLLCEWLNNDCPYIPVYFYNFGWNDYGVASLTSILDMVKVMSFAMQEGKMAVHCHAGLGRTGNV